MSALLPPSATSVFFRAGDGTRLHALRWDADRPRALVLLSPGLGEHAGRYAAFARDLVPRGISVRALDPRGHGRSGGVRGYARRFSLLVDDFECFRQRAMEDVADDVPVFVLGHSFGGLVVIRWIEGGAGPGELHAGALHAVRRLAQTGGDPHPPPPSPTASSQERGRTAGTGPPPFHAGPVGSVETARWNHERPRKLREASGGWAGSTAGSLPIAGASSRRPCWGWR